MSYQVNTRVFEGPLDLLLQLITSRQLEITELDLSGIVTEYLGYLAAMRELDLEVTSEFLLIAATLIQLKARRLLPDDPAIDLDEELVLAEERDRLLARLLACLTFKDVAAVLAHRIEANDRYLARYAGLDRGTHPSPVELRMKIGSGQLARIAAGVLSRPREPQLDHLRLDLVSVTEAIADVRSRVRDAVETDFDRLTEDCATTGEIVAYFLAVLELCRWGVVDTNQEHREAPITIRHRPDAPALEHQSEWST
ncbi:MAG: segregation and condensation protein A [Acidimicrobiia bacterium]